MRSIFKFAPIFVIFISIALAQDSEKVFGRITNYLMLSQKLEKSNTDENEIKTAKGEYKPSEIIAGIKVTNFEGTHVNVTIESGGINQTDVTIMLTSEKGKNINSLIEIYGPEKNEANIVAVPILLSLVLLGGVLLSA